MGSSGLALCSLLCRCSIFAVSLDWKVAKERTSKWGEGELVPIIFLI